MFLWGKSQTSAAAGPSVHSPASCFCSRHHKLSTTTVCTDVGQLVVTIISPQAMNDHPPYVLEFFGAAEATFELFWGQDWAREQKKKKQKKNNTQQQSLRFLLVASTSP